MKKGKKSDADDEALWQVVTASVKAYGRRKPTVSPPPPSRAPVPSKTVLTPPSKPPQAFDRGTEENLRKGKFDIDRRLDLHGMTQNEAYAALARFIAASDRADRRTLLIITGKGKGGEGVLRRLLPLWIEEPTLKSRILAIAPARPEHGGSGAFYLRLRKKKQA